MSAKDALTNKISEINAHHDSYQQKTDERLDILCEKLSTIAKNANALITDSRFNVSSDISGGTSNDPESIRASDLDSASRTLGFFPVTSTDSSNAAAAFMAELEKVLTFRIANLPDYIRNALQTFRISIGLLSSFKTFRVAMLPCYPESLEKP